MRINTNYLIQLDDKAPWPRSAPIWLCRRSGISIAISHIGFSFFVLIASRAQCSADTVVNGSPAGALTSALVSTLKERNMDTTWLDLLYALRTQLQYECKLTQLSNSYHNLRHYCSNTDAH